MRRYRNRHDGTEVALANFALTFAKALLVFCVVLFLMINPHNGIDGTKPNAEYLITVDWSVAGRYDVDTWIRLPDGSIVYYNNKESAVVFLERDDLGQDCNLNTNAGKPVNMCEEITVIRGIATGEYELALHLYSVNGDEKPTSCPPVTVHVKIEKLNPTITILWQTTVVLDSVRGEKPLVRFTVNSDASVSDFSNVELPSLVYDKLRQ